MGGSMKIRLQGYWLLPLILGICTIRADAATQDAMPSLAMGQTQTASAAQQIRPVPEKLLQAGPLFFRGTLGDDQVQANLRAKADIAEGFEGDYFLFGHSQKVLLAGEIDGDDIFMEESVNGTDVSGQWNGKLDGDVVSGTWQSADGLVTKPFAMKIVRNTTPPARSASKISGKARQ
jgi:hypothetical protein